MVSMHDLKWSEREKKIARRAYEAAREAILEKLVVEFKSRAASVNSASDVWDIEDYLRSKRQFLDELLDYRYSRLCLVFAQLMRMGHLDEKLLTGLSEDKMEIIRDLREGASVRG